MNDARKAAGQGRAVHGDGEGSILLYLGRGGGGALRHLSTQAQRRLVEVEERLLLLALGAARPDRTARGAGGGLACGRRERGGEPVRGGAKGEHIEDRRGRRLLDFERQQLQRRGIDPSEPRAVVVYVTTPAALM